MIVLLRQDNAITNAKVDLKCGQRDLVYLLIREMQKGDPIGKEYCVSVEELEKATGPLSAEALAEITGDLVTKTYTIEKKPGSFLIVSLMTKVHYISELKQLRITVSRNILPYFIELKENFTEFRLDMALSLKSIYSKRMYEILCQCKAKGFLSIEVDYLKNILSIKDHKTEEDKYEGWSMFKKHVLDKPQKELAEKTDISYEYKAIKTGKKFTHLEFKIYYNPR